MKFKNLLDNLVDALSAVRLGGKANAKLGALDRGVLEVGMLVAALDGDMLPSEFAAFDRLVKACRGYTEKNAHECLRRSLRRAGYLMAMVKSGAFSEAERIETFVEGAEDAMPGGFANGSLADVRRAFALWVAMGMSDGEFSGIERKAIAELSRHFAVVKLARAQDEEERWAALSPAFRQAFCTGRVVTSVKFLEDDFLERAERIIGELAVPAKRERAEAALEQLVGRVAVPATAAEASGEAKLAAAIAISAK